MDDPTAADAVATAMWWLANIENLADPEEVLAITRDGRDAEVGFLLARIEAELRSEPPAGSLAPAEIAGPYGMFTNLDLDRSVVPGESELPPVGTVLRDDASPFRLSMRTRDAFYGPPASMAAEGIYLAAWTIEIGVGHGRVVGGGGAGRFQPRS